MLSLATKLSELARINKNTVSGLRKLEVETVRDLLFHFPYRYLDFSEFKPIKDIQPGDVVTVRGKIKTIASRFSFRGRVGLAEAVISDDTGSMKVVWFNQGYLASTLQKDDEVLLAGPVSKYKTLQLQNPIWEKYTQDSTHTGRLVPVYRLTEGLYHRTIRNLAKQVLPLASEVTDIIPTEILKQHKLLSLSEAVEQLHFPTSEVKLKKAQKRIIFDEILVQQLAVQMHHRKLEQSLSPIIPPDIELIKEFLATLPFNLTNGQKRALWDIVKDMAEAKPMNRLLEGDVGSGKTLVAVAATLEVVNAGFQAVILAPTEILARQHYESLRNYLRNYPHVVGLLTRNFQLANDNELNKSAIHQSIAKGEVSIVVATHAILQEDIKFAKLGLIIIDEQHRFGVEQRKVLTQANKDSVRPHLLSMSATPIPRTLALAFYQDLSISTLAELPRGRQTIITELVSEEGRDQAYDFIRSQMNAGRQVFIVTPRVEESDTTTIKSAKAELDRLQSKVFPEFKLGLIHGKLSGAEKERIMTQFHDHELDILVATSVIEIGIDVPNATVMVIEDAERFGLAQLHQLRGRVGRGQHQSHCLLFTQSQDAKSLQRLKQFSQIHDGFKLAELDLEQRGFGSLFGTQQTGWDFKYSQYLTMNVLKIAQQAAIGLLALDPLLQKHLALKKQVDPLLSQIHLE